MAHHLKMSGISPAIELNENDIPLVYILRVHNRDMLRSYLMDRKIFCAVHWPFDNHQSEQRPFAKRNSEELLSLPIDQRYDNAHIMYLVNETKQYGGDLIF